MAEYWQVIVFCNHAISLWRHEMETFSALRAICAGHSPVTGELETVSMEIVNTKYFV